MIPARTNLSDEKWTFRQALVFSAIVHIAVIAWSIIPMAIGPAGEVVGAIESRLSDTEVISDFENISTDFTASTNDDLIKPRPNDNHPTIYSVATTGHAEPRPVPFPDGLFAKSSRPTKSSQPTAATNPTSTTAPKPTGNAVTKGSFTVWTSPEVPEVRQNYWVFIAVSLPEQQANVPGSPRVFPASDVTGRVKGSDTYTQSLLFDRRFPGVVEFLNLSGQFVKATKTTRIPIQNRRVQIRVLVAGAELPKTIDLIRLRSRLLRETQDLKLTFKSKRRQPKRRSSQGLPPIQP